MNELTQPIADACDRALLELPPGRIHDAIEAVRHRLGEEGLRVAVAGRVSTGKSTLVNALLKRRVAPTAAGECTQVVTWFRYGVPARAEVVLKAGGTRELPLVGGKLPEALGASVEDVESVVVYLPDQVLRRMILIDTPGLSSVDEQRSDRTEALLAMHVATRGALAEADALVFLMSQTAREDDEMAIRAFSEATTGVEASAARTIGVLSMADKIAGGDMRIARDLADEFAAALHPKVSTVIPLIALLGETAEVLTERDAADLKQLAGVPRGERDLALSDVGLFRDLPGPLGAEERERLLRLLDLFGISYCVALIEAGRHGASALADGLREVAGVGRLTELLATTFDARADLLRAHAALSALASLSYEPFDPRTEPVLASLRNEVERLRNRPAMHRILELWAVEQVSGKVEAASSEKARGIPEELRADVALIASDASISVRLGLDEGAPVEALVDAAKAGASRWQAFKVQGAMSPQEQQIAAVFARSYKLMWSGLERPSG